MEPEVPDAPAEPDLDAIAQDLADVEAALERMMEVRRAVPIGGPVDQGDDRRHTP